MRFRGKTIRITIIVLIFITFAVHILKIAIEGEKGRLKRTIIKSKKCLEKKDLIKLAECISSNYYDELENDKRSLLFTAASFFDSYDNLAISLDLLEIDIKEASAIIEIEATVYWVEKGSTNLNYDNVRVNVKYRKENKSWKLIRLKFPDTEKKRLFMPSAA